MGRPKLPSRRTVLKGLAASGAAMLGGWGPRTLAQTAADKPALLVVFFEGGFNALFNSSDSFAEDGTFGVTAENQLPVGNGLVLDRPTFGTLPSFALEHIATVGVRHGLSNHEGAQEALWTQGGRSYALRLASALGGDAAIKCAVLGSDRPAGPAPAESNVSLQSITDMQSTIAALGGYSDPTIPNRAIALGGLKAAQAMSESQVNGNPRMLRHLGDALATGIDTLSKPVQEFDYRAMAEAYQHPVDNFGVDSFRSKMVAAELMINAGANVVIAQDNGWDSHGDRDGSDVRAQMSRDILPGSGSHAEQAGVVRERVT